MSRSPTHPDRELDDADVEAILGGGPVDVRLDRLATFTRLVRTALLDVPDPVPSGDLARILRGEEPVAGGVGPGASPGDRRSFREHRPGRRRGVPVVRVAGLGLVAKVALGASAAAACVTGAGAAGVLPGSTNDTVRNAIETVTPVEFDHRPRRPDAGPGGGAVDGRRPGDEDGPWGEGPGHDDDRDGPGDGGGSGPGDPHEGRDDEDNEAVGEAPGPGGHPDPGDSAGDDLVRPDSTGPGRVDDVGPGAGDQDDPGHPGGAGGADGPGAMTLAAPAVSTPTTATRAEHHDRATPPRRQRGQRKRSRALTGR